jgi:hypothetical protein
LGFVDIVQKDFVVGTEKCECMKKYAALFPLLDAGFPLEDIILAVENRLDEIFELLDPEGYYKRALESSKQFITNGAGLVLIGPGWSQAVVKLLEKMEVENMPLLVGFNASVFDAEVLVLSLSYNPDEIPKVIERRVKSLKPTIVCFDSRKEMEKWWPIIDALGYDGKAFNGPVFRSCDVTSKLQDDRWK